jgi:Cellulose binding domain/Putative Ig domain
MRMPKTRSRAEFVVLGLCAAAVAAVPSTNAQAASASNTLVVNAAASLRPVTHVASGALYGLATNGTPSASLVNPLHPSSFVQMGPGGTQRPGGDSLVVAPEAAAAGAKVVVRMPDWYPNFPYQWVSWSDWLSAVDKQIASVKASGAANIGAYEIWNEPDWTWNTSAAGAFNAGWVRTYQEIRAKDATTPIDGPSFSFYGQSTMSGFLSNAKATGTLPDLVSWHELGNDQNIAADVASYRSLESSLGISPRPIIIEEYASRTEVGVPGSLVGYIAKFERAGVTYADLPFWNDYGTIGDLLVSRGGAANAGWWLYKWYGDMSGEMLSTTPPAQTGIDGAAAVNAARNQVSVIVGGGSGDAAVTVNGLSSLSGFGAGAHVVVEHVVSQGRTTASTPQTMSTTDIPISGGSISVPIPAMNAADGYHLIITPSAGSSSGNTVTVTNPGNQSGTTHATIAPLQIHATDSAAGQSLTYSATGLPTGLSISTAGVISGTLGVSGTFNSTVTAKDSTGASGSASFTWTVSDTRPAGTCHVDYTKASEWAGGFTANVTITNTSTVTVNGWTLMFSFPGDQKITSAWNASVTQSGASVTAVNMSYNAAIAPSGNVQFGFQGTWTANDTSPSAFAVNGIACG